MRILDISKLGMDKVIAEVNAAIEVVIKARGADPLTVFPTGGRSALYYGPGLFERPCLPSHTSVLLTDTYLWGDAVAQGRPDTNQGSVLSAGLTLALTNGFVHPRQLAWPDHSLGNYQDIARCWGEELVKRRGEPKADVMIASSGGGKYFEGGPEDPGHFLGIPHGQPALFERRDPFIVVNDMPKPPSVRISAAPWLALEAGVFILFVLGEGKRNALENILVEKDPVDCPAATITRANNGILVTDIAV